MKLPQIGIIIIAIFPLITFSCKEKEIYNIDITEFQWKLVAINFDGKELTASKDEYFREDAFLLVFTSDSTFSLNTSVNYAQGKYSIDQNGIISISNYHEFTEVAVVDTNEKELNSCLIKSINMVEEYMTTENSLILEGECLDIKFNKYK